MTQMAAFPHVDVVVLIRPGQTVPAHVRNAIDCQVGVRTTLHVVEGRRLPTDSNRCETIARARQTGRRCGTSPWLMFVDDDVVLHPECMAQLLAGLKQRPTHAALAADYSRLYSLFGPSAHVTIGAILFRRAAFRYFDFRQDHQRCECRCCSDDLRQAGLQIDYLPGALACHRPAEHRSKPVMEKVRLKATDSASPRILVAVNRRHVDRLRGPFLRTLRAHGNTEDVIVVGYGFYPSEVQRLNSQTNVTVVNHAVNGIMPPIRRLRDFQPIVAALPPQTPVAYWDAGDVIFQAALNPLWRLVRQSPNRLLAVREPKGFPDNVAVTAWTVSIRNPHARRRAFRLFARNPFLNSGFAAGTARTMLNYLRSADFLRHSDHLAGTTDWGDQSALNLYCHSSPTALREISECWNYCIHDRPRGEVYVTPTGTVASRNCQPIAVVHGNARSLRKLWLPRFGPVTGGAVGA